MTKNNAVEVQKRLSIRVASLNYIMTWKEVPARLNEVEWICYTNGKKKKSFADKIFHVVCNLHVKKMFSNIVSFVAIVFTLFTAIFFIFEKIRLNVMSAIQKEKNLISKKYFSNSLLFFKVWHVCFSNCQQFFFFQFFVLALNFFQSDLSDPCKAFIRRVLQYNI